MVIRLISLHELDVLFFEGKVKNKCDLSVLVITSKLTKTTHSLEYC